MSVNKHGPLLPRSAWVVSLALQSYSSRWVKVFGGVDQDRNGEAGGDGEQGVRLTIYFARA